MSKRKKLARIDKDISCKISDIMAILEVLSDTEQSRYPTNVMIEIASRKAKRLFKNIEISRKILTSNKLNFVSADLQTHHTKS